MLAVCGSGNLRGTDQAGVCIICRVLIGFDVEIFTWYKFDLQLIIVDVRYCNVA